MSVGQRFDADGIQETGVPTTRPSLQSLLLEAGVASEEDLRDAFEEGQRRGVRLGEILLGRGWLNQEGLATLLARQWGLPFLGRESLGLDPAATQLLPAEQARALRGCVVGVSDGGPLVVVAEPTSERLSRLTALLGETARFAVVTESSLEGLLEQRARMRPNAPPAEPGPDAAASQNESAGPAPAPAADRAESAADEALPGSDDAQTDALVAQLEQATAGLSAARERIEQLAGARRGAEQMVADLHRRLAGVDQERTREQEHARDLQEQLDAERERSREFRRRLAELLAELED